MKYVTWFIVFVSMCMLLASCDISSREVVSGSVNLTIPSGKYLDIAWFAREEIAMTYTDLSDTLGMDRYQVNLYSLFSGESDSLPIPTPYEECTTVWTLWIERLPNDKLGITRLCWFLTEHSSNQFTDILAYDASTKEFDHLSRTPIGEAVVSFSFAPDMSTSLQTLDNSGGLVSQVVRVDKTGQASYLFGNFIRTRDATFSPSGEQFAFLGNEYVPSIDDGRNSQQSTIQQKISFPWTLYQADSTNNIPKAVVDNIRFGQNAKWSPTGPFLAFQGEVQSMAGVWIIQLKTGQLYRIWEKSVPFDWSPDGKKIVVINSTTINNQGAGPSQLVVLTLSLPQNPN